MMQYPADIAHAFFYSSGLPSFMHPPLTPFVFAGAPPKRSLPTDFPDYLTYVMRETLCGTTTTLSRAAAQTHDVFLGLNQAMAFDRTMRIFNPGMATSASAWRFFAPFALTAPPPQARPLLTYDGANRRALPKPQPAEQREARGSNPALDIAAPALATAMTIAATCLTVTPILMESYRLTI